MTSPLSGIHHATCICGDPQANVDFYTGVLGLRLVKQTVNFEDPTTWHLYYGDAAGSPGTILTFFAWPDAPAGQVGIGQFGSIALAVPAGAFGFWIERLVARGIPHSHPATRFGERFVSFRDPDGLTIELVATTSAPSETAWDEGGIPADRAITRIHGVGLWTQESNNPDAFFTETLGFTSRSRQAERHRLSIGEGPHRANLDLLQTTGLWNGTIAVGAIHHVAWQVANDEQQIEWQESLQSKQIDVTEVRNRAYFKSIYFDEPGGAHQEIATNGPGFATDESPAELGSSLKLPNWLESTRLGLEGSLPPIQVP
jgi:catechol 2,3-dioxygenase-like lactoylglutathione lyase family enzyme